MFTLEATLIAAMCLLCGCNLPAPPIGPKPKPDGKNTCEQFDASIKSYPYVASNERKDKIIQNYGKLEVGMSKDRIAELIGDPDYSQLDYGPKGPRAKWLGSNWMYYIRKQEDLVNMKDPCIQIFFDIDGHAHWLVPQAIDGLEEKGGAAVKP
jgi:hypothetical protein